MEADLPYTYDRRDDAFYLYLSETASRRDERKSSVAPFAFNGATIIVSYDEDGQAFGVEFLGASRIFTPDALAALEAGPSGVPPSP